MPCLAALGYVVPEPPSVETFVDIFDTGEGYVLSGQLAELGHSDSVVADALAQCPEFPDSSELYR